MPFLYQGIFQLASRGFLHAPFPSECLCGTVPGKGLTGKLHSFSLGSLGGCLAVSSEDALDL